MMRSILDQDPRQDLRQRIVSVLIDTAAEPAEKASLSMLGAHASDARHDIYEAKKSVRAALTYDPGNTEARTFLLERRNDSAWHDVLEKDLLPVLRNENAVDALHKTIEALAANERNDVKKAAYAAEVANLLSNTDGNKERALNAWLQALRAHPHSPSYLENAVNAVDSDSDAILLVDTLESIAEDTKTDEVKASLYAAAGHAQLERLGDTQSGVANLLRAMQVNPRNERALDGLETYYLETADYNGLATLLEARLNATRSEEHTSELHSPTRRSSDLKTDEVKASLYAAAGHAQLERLGDTQSGVANLLRAMQVNPRNERALDGLETYYLETADYNGLATLLEARLNATDDPEARRTLADRVVTLLRGELGRPNDAAKVLEQSLLLRGPDEHLRE